MPISPRLQARSSFFNCFRFCGRAALRFVPVETIDHQSLNFCESSYFSELNVHSEAFLYLFQGRNSAIRRNLLDTGHVRGRESYQIGFAL
jgi:hypothetical protein